MKDLSEFEERLAAIESRNARVTADKAWETSAVRRLSIATLTYAVVFVYLNIIHNSSLWINAFVPVMGYLLSTLALARIKASWIHNVLKNKKDS